MSNFDSGSKIQKKTDVPNLKNLKWQSIQTDLHCALSEWNDFDSVDQQKTPEELQLEKVKSIIENIKDKLNQF